jgi:diguanylate cyclase (GGDEF)-like protein/PAS domain S-box-containing protein
MSASPDINSLMDVVVGNMDQGLLVVSADLSVPILNVRATELIDLPLSFATDPPTFPEILAYQVEIGAITPAYMKSSINDFILRGDVLTETHTYTRKTATGRWLDVRTTPLPQGGFVRTFTDQTERHEVSEAKKRSENAYQALFENAAIGIYRSSADGRQIRANPELVALNGYHNENDLLRGVSDIGKEWYVDPNRRAQFAEAMNRDGRVTEFESEVYRHLTRERIWISETAWVIRNEVGEIVNYEGTVTEITERKKIELMINHAAHHDELTGLQNRARFNKVLANSLESGKPFALAYLDLDNFKHVNDTYGHGCGDQLLISVSKRFVNALGNEDGVFRIGGDEFAIILTGSDLIHARLSIDRLIAATKTPFQIDQVTVEVGVSVGVAHSTQGLQASDILHSADLELYRAKAVTGSAASFVESIPASEETFRHSA